MRFIQGIPSGIASKSKIATKVTTKVTEGTTGTKRLLEKGDPALRLGVADTGVDSEPSTKRQKRSSSLNSLRTGGMRLRSKGDARGVSMEPKTRRGRRRRSAKSSRSNSKDQQVVATVPVVYELADVPKHPEISGAELDGNHSIDKKLSTDNLALKGKARDCGPPLEYIKKSPR